MYIWWNYFIIYQFISTPPVIYAHHQGHSTFSVGRDVRGGSPKWPGALVFQGGYHPHKTSCKLTVGANRLAGPIISRTDHYLSSITVLLVFGQKMRTSGVAFFTFLRHNVNAHLLSGLIHANLQRDSRPPLHCWELLTHVHLMELFSMGLRYQFISTPPVIYAHHQGYTTFFVGRDVRGGSSKWPGALVFQGGYHPHKTCKSTVGANRLAGPIISWTDHYLSVNNSPISIWPKNENIRSGVLHLPQAQCKRTFTIRPTCNVTVGCPSRVNVQETDNSLCFWSCWSFSH